MLGDSQASPVSNDVANVYSHLPSKKEESSSGWPQDLSTSHLEQTTRVCGFFFFKYRKSDAVRKLQQHMTQVYRHDRLESRSQLLMHCCPVEFRNYGNSGLHTATSLRAES